ncbi:MAG: hypothetical protein U0002_19645 [Thermoanaerobaculia bacterium]
MTPTGRQVVQLLLATFLERGVDPYSALRRTSTEPPRRERALSGAELAGLRRQPGPVRCFPPERSRRRFSGR